MGASLLALAKSIYYLLRTKSDCFTSLVCSLTPSGHYCNFFPCKRKFYWKGKKSTNKECCIAVVAGLLRNKHIKQTFSIRLKRLTSAGVSISCESCFACACVRSHSITTHRINVTAVRVGRAFVDIYIQTCCYNYKHLKASTAYIHNLYYAYTRILEWLANR